MNRFDKSEVHTALRGEYFLGQEGFGLEDRIRINKKGSLYIPTLDWVLYDR